MLQDQFIVNNAGLVLLHAWFPMLFARLGLVEGDRFASKAAQSKAVHVLQFLASGQEDVPEIRLPLNKVLCGLPLDAELAEAAPLSELEKETCTSLIAAAAGYWPAIGKTSVDGFRGNWLVRDATMQETGDRWELNVQPNPYDVLLSRSPFSYSVVRHPWMAKLVRVTWPS